MSCLILWITLLINCEKDLAKLFLLGPNRAEKSTALPTLLKEALPLCSDLFLALYQAKNRENPVSLGRMSIN